MLIGAAFAVLGLTQKIDFLMGKRPLLTLFPEDDNAEAHEGAQASEAR
jgi:hypothetical protein